MKKLLFFALLATTFVLTSCSKESIVNHNNSNMPYSHWYTGWEALYLYEDNTFIYFEYYSSTDNIVRVDDEHNNFLCGKYKITDDQIVFNELAPHGEGFDWMVAMEGTIYGDVMNVTFSKLDGKKVVRTFVRSYQYK
jgi:hypothetical protein